MAVAIAPMADLCKFSGKLLWCVFLPFVISQHTRNQKLHWLRVSLRRCIGKAFPANRLFDRSLRHVALVTKSAWNIHFEWFQDVNVDVVEDFVERAKVFIFVERGSEELLF